MGCCCSVDKEIIKQEREATNPLEDQKDWIARMTADIGYDVYAVARDFPRMNVLDVDPDVRGAGNNGTSDMETGNSTVPCPPLTHHERFVRTIIGIAARCQEADTVGQRVEQWWREAQSQMAVNESEFHALLSQPDSNPVMRKLQLDTALIAPIQRSESSTEPIEETIKYHADCKTFQVLEHLVQGVVFYPTQRLRYLLWFPWCSQLTDVEWNCFVFTRPRFPEHIYVVHRILSRNYVDAKHKQSTPTFEFEWDLIIALRQDSNCAFDDVRIEMRRVSITNGTSKPDASPLCGCESRSDVHLREDRIAQLSQRVLDMFNVEVEEK